MKTKIILVSEQGPFKAKIPKMCMLIQSQYSSVKSESPLFVSKVNPAQVLCDGNLPGQLILNTKKEKATAVFSTVTAERK